ncbi:hypothetical protein [Streptomyces sp. NPDC050507]|uniref:hypothetical protein n=1 Tax=Streptomyces sp. NPDC050507 TaxID=3365619 RepID=UPI0037B32C3D
MLEFKRKTGATIQEAFTPRPKRDGSGKVVKDEKGRPVASDDMDPEHLVALVWLVARKDNPAFTYDDALNIPAVELEVASAEDEAEDPKEPTN